MRISFSHHHDVVALAVSPGASVGTDVLEIPVDARFVADTALVLSPQEIAFVRAAPPHLQGAAFAQCWTRKEAYAKCRGYGLTRDLPKITLTPWTAGQREATLWSLELERVVVAVAIAATGSPDARLHGSTPIANGSMFHCQIHADEPSDARPLARRHARSNRSLHGDELVETTSKRESLADHG
jgi:phosphopantetheinyl transferase (holo-ACP synthase)